MTTYEEAFKTLGRSLDMLRGLPPPGTGAEAPRRGRPPKAKANGKNGHPKAAAVKPVKASAKNGAKPEAKSAKTSSAIAKGRRAVASGERPKLAVAIYKVMGKEALKSAEIVQRLEDKGWMPEAKRPQPYISAVLGANPELFERKSWGKYARIEGALEKWEKAGKAEGVSSKAEPVTASEQPVEAASDPTNTEATEEVEEKQGAVDESLKDLGIKDGAIEHNPFADD